MAPLCMSHSTAMHGMGLIVMHVMHEVPETLHEFPSFSSWKEVRAASSYA
jgi:hypothetical protein